MYLALLEIGAAKGRFALMGSVVVLVAALVGIVSGFTTGLGDDTVSALRALPADHLAFASDAKTDQFNRSLVGRSALDGWTHRRGVRDAAALGVSITRGTTDRGVDVDLAAFGVQPHSFLAPRPRHGRPLGHHRDGIVVSRKIADQGVHVGDTLTVDRLGIRLRVDGVAGPVSYGHVPVAYLPLDTWERVRFTTPRTGTGRHHTAPAASAAVPDQFSGVALRTGPDATDAALTAADHALHTRTTTLEEAYAAAPGYSGERLTMNSIQVFLYLIAPLVVGAFFAVWTVQRGPELALLRALGASRRRLLGHTLAQAVVVVVAGTAAGGAIACAMGLAVGGAVPFSLPAAPLTATLATVAAVGLAGAALTLRRVTTADPMTMLGAAR